MLDDENDSSESDMNKKLRSTENKVQDDEGVREDSRIDAESESEIRKEKSCEKRNDMDWSSQFSVSLISY